MPKRIKIARLQPTEAMLVSLVRLPSARSATFHMRSADAKVEPDDEVVCFRSEGKDPRSDAPEGCEPIKLHVEIRSVDEARRIVYGEVYNPPFEPVAGAEYSAEEIARHVDSYGTFMTRSDIEWMAHRFLTVSRGIDVEHDQVAGRGVPVESVIVRSAEGKGWPHPGGVWTDGAWVMGTHVPGDAEWERVMRGRQDPSAAGALNGYSIFVMGRRIAPVEVVVKDVEQRSEPEQPPAAEPPEKRGKLASAFRALGVALGLLDEQPAAGEQRTEQPEQREDPKPITDFAQAWAVMQTEEKISSIRWTLWRVIENIIASSEITDKNAAIAKAFDAAKATLIALVSQAQVVAASKRSQETDPFGLLTLIEVEQRAGRKMSKARLEKFKTALQHMLDIMNEVDDEAQNRSEENMPDLKLDDIKAAIADAVKPLGERLASIEQRSAPPAEGDDKPLDEDAVKRAVAEAIKPFGDKLGEVEIRVGKTEQRAQRVESRTRALATAQPARQAARDERGGSPDPKREQRTGTDDEPARPQRRSWARGRFVDLATEGTDDDE